MINQKEQRNSQNDDIDFSNLFSIISRNKIVFFLIISGLTTFSIIYNVLKKPVYKGYFDIVVKSDQIANKNSLSLLAPINNAKANDTQKLILKSPSVLLPVFELVKDYNKINGQNSTFLFNDWLRTLSIEFEKGTNVLRVNSFNSNKELIIFTLENISKKYKKYSQELEIAEIKKTIAFLEKEKRKLEKKAIESQKKFNSFSIENGLGPIDGIVDLDNNEMISLREYKDSKNNLDIFRRRFNRQKEGLRYVNQFQLLKEFEAEYTNLKSKLKPNSKTLINLQQEINNLKEYLKRPNQILINYGILKEKAARNTSLLYAAERELAIAKINLNNTPNAWEMISSPRVERKKASPKTLKNVVFSFFASIILSLTIVFLKNKKDDLTFDYEKIDLYIDYLFIDTIYKKSKEVNSMTLNKIVVEKNIQDKKIGIILFNKTNKNQFSIEQLFLKTNNVIYTNLNEDKVIEKLDNLIIIFESGAFTSEDLKYINKYTYKIKNKVIGWLLLSNKNFIGSKNIENMMRINN